MKRRYFSFIAISLILVMLVLSTGCGIRINGKEYELFSANKDDKYDVSIGVGSETSNIQKISEDGQDGEQLVVSDSFGNIRIEKSGSSRIEIKAEKKVKGSSKAEKIKILDNMDIQLERDGKVIKITVKTKDGKDFWDWQKEDYKMLQTSVNYDIKLPQRINVIEAKTGAGNIDINDVSAKLSLDTGAGNIDVQDVDALEDSSLNTGAGNIDFSGNADKISSFDASTGIGNIKFEVPEGTKMSLDADTGIGVLSGEFINTTNDEKFHFEGDINGGGPGVKLNTGAGNVKADKN